MPRSRRHPRNCRRCRDRQYCRKGARCRGTCRRGTCRSLRPNSAAFTLLELLLVIAICALLFGLLLPALSKAKTKGRQLECLNHLRQWGFAYHLYAEDQDDAVPEEGNTTLEISHTQNRVAWYNKVTPYVGELTLVELYAKQSPPLPFSRSLFACPAAPAPSPPAFPSAATPTFSRAYFMYGINGRLCRNRTGSGSGAPVQRLSMVPNPSDVILQAEVDGNSPVAGVAQSNVTGQYAVGRHQRRGHFALCDGSARAIRTNEFLRTPAEANDAATEWLRARTVYWYPTRTTPN